MVLLIMSFHTQNKFFIANYFDTHNKKLTPSIVEAIIINESFVVILMMSNLVGYHFLEPSSSIATSKLICNSVCVSVILT